MSAPRTSFVRRLWRCALLHPDTYEEVEAEVRSIRQATVIVLAAAGSASAGAWLESLTWRTAGSETLGLGLGLEVAARGFEPVVFWLGGAAFAYMVGSSFFRGPHTETDYAEVLRTTGFAFGPSLFTALACLPPAEVGIGVLWLFRLWTLLALMIAVRQALDFTTGRALGTVLVAWVIGWLVLWGLVSVLLQTIDLLGI